MPSTPPPPTPPTAAPHVPAPHTPPATSGTATAHYALQARLLLLVCALLLLAWAAVSVLTYRNSRHEVGKLLDAHLAQTAHLLAAQSLHEIDEHALQAQDHESSPRRDKHYRVPLVFQVWRKGELVARSAYAPTTPLLAANAHQAHDDDDDDDDDDDEDNGHPPSSPARSHQRPPQHHPQPPGHLLAGGLPVHRRDDHGFYTVQMGSARWRVYRAEGRQDQFTVLVAENLGARRRIVLASIGSLWRSLLVVFPLLALLFWGSLYLSMRPLRRIGENIRQRSPLSTAPLHIARLPREISPLVDALNQLFVRVGEMVHSERRFTADAAHELRTPIAAIRMMAQVAQGSHSDTERQQALTGVLQGCDRATHLVAQLLQLARLEADAATSPAAGAPPAAPDSPTHDILPALQQVRDDLTHTLATPRMQHIDWHAPATLPAPIPPALAAMLLRNLLDNALRYSPQGARVRVTLQSSHTPDNTPQTMQWTVEDSGAGMSDADMARLGQRFFRVVGSQSSGSGLGWSIVRRIATLAGLHIHTDRSPDLGGLRVRIHSGTHAF